MATDRAVALLVLRVAGAGLLLTMGAIHLYLWSDGYRDLAKIGVLFLLNAIGAGVLGLAVLASPTRYLGVPAVLGSLFTLGTLAGLVVSLTSGLFGFQEVIGAPWVRTTIWVESAGVLVLAGLAVLAFAGAGRPGRRQGWGRLPSGSATSGGGSAQPVGHGHWPGRRTPR
ncbi:hypothetical protein [Wenjunlia tyrosinilytica]|jgi:hypothetical protein|uniref:Uncharacterized protein n=1 Tax=Wenjunlia tyrosinilytica TaxID=1544741 RepID=A0A917ZFV7_9ACTN|nr:hypothetical protein [Wenjunlia tyrosinilytica]GGO81364.1 hypothetical protein GCM10012280_05410 [Wenjunlia tyrosinilytica]